jgi:hypothetical protein
LMEFGISIRCKIPAKPVQNAAPWYNNGLFTIIDFDKATQTVI